MLVKEEVPKAWQLPLLIDKLALLPDAVAGPLGIAQQETIDELSQQVPKDWVTLDQSKAFGSGQLVNNRVQTEELTICRYRFALRPLINLIIALWTEYPSMALFLSKLDFKSAYRHLHNAARTALQQSIVTTQGFGT